MSGYLLDTNVLSELNKPRPNRAVVDFISSRPLSDLYLSSITLAEIRFGIDLVTDPTRRSHLISWLANKVRPMFSGRILDVDEDVLLKWRHIIEAGRRRGHTFSHPDVLIAAVAGCNGMTVLTGNDREFVMTDIPVINPWRS